VAIVSARGFRLATDRCFVIGEVAMAHDGSLGLAHAFIDAIAAAGADAVKFQTHIAAAESTPAEPFRVQASPQDATRYDYWLRTAFTADEWRGLAERCEARGVTFLSSPFSIEAVDLLDGLGMPAWKVGSGEVGNTRLLDRMAATRKPVILSSGMSSMAEVDSAVDRVRRAGAEVAVMQCTTVYPCPPERVGLNMIPILRARYGCPVGLSDHSGTMYAGLSAATMGIEILEVHVTMSRSMFGPDVPASVTLDELRQLVEGVRFIERMRACPVEKDALAVELRPLRDIFTRSVVATIDLPVGAVLRDGDLAAKKPGTGIPGSRLPDLVGRRLRRAVAANALLSEDDLEESHAG
jgi:N,N'-diacetyllegionaminate synthase